MEKDSSIYIAGRYGLAGSAIERSLKRQGYTNISGHRSNSMDFRNDDDVSLVLQELETEYLFIAAATVGGIFANMNFPADFIYNNLKIQTSLLYGAYNADVKKVLFLGSSCIYPKNCPQPMKEEDFMSGPLEPTNDAYAVAKIAGIKMCEAFRFQHKCNFISCMPTNMYGPNDNYHHKNSHVLPALIKKIHDAKICQDRDVPIWGSGKPRREFLHSDDFGDAAVFLMEKYNESGIVNIGSGDEIRIYDLARLIAEVIGYKGMITPTENISDGMSRKLLDCSKINRMGWSARISLEEGIASTYKEFLKTGGKR